jgi:hypothetical protein
VSQVGSLHIPLQNLPDKKRAHDSLYKGQLSPIAVFRELYRGSRSILGAVGADCFAFAIEGGRSLSGRVGVADGCCNAAPLMVAAMVSG